MYADETVVNTYAKTAELASEKLTTAMERIAEWLDQSLLSLNTGKAKSMFFSKTKYLGVILDPYFNFKKHDKKMIKHKNK